MKIPRTAIKKARIEIIPMIDVIFFLLVFFMFSSMAMLRMKGLGLNVPTAAQQTGAAPAAPKATAKIVITRAPNGETYIGRKRVTSDNLSAQLQSAANKTPGALMILNVAKNQSTQTLVDILDAAARVKTKDGAPISVLVASEPVDAEGNALR